MARVPAADAFDLDKYEYWWGREQGWKSEPLTEFNCETAVMWGAGQGQIVYNKHFETYFYVGLDLGKFCPLFPDKMGLTDSCRRNRVFEGCPKS